MKIQPIYKIVNQIKDELKAWNVTIELNTDLFEEDGVEVEETNFRIIIFCEHIKDPVQISIPVEDIDDYDLENTLQMLKFELDNYVEGDNLYYHNISLRLH